MPDAMAILAEPRRREILRLVWDREMAAGEIASQFDVTFGAVSQHLAVLREGGLVVRRREGKKQFYTADRAALGPLGPMLEAMWSDRLAVLKREAEAEQRAIDLRRARGGASAERPARYR